MREIVTLQFGNYANYIGTHWWNIQESTFNYEPTETPSEINHDVLYREGVNLNRQTTYTPRLLLVDLDGSLKHLPKEGELYANAAEKKVVEHWTESKVEVIEQPAAKKHEFQQDLANPTAAIEEREYSLSESVDSWVDYTYSRFHPRTVHVVKAYKHDKEQQNLDTISLGREIWNTPQFEDDFCNNIRQYVEECDGLQGFQNILDGNNGFAGLATKCIEHCNDEYGKANLAIPVYAPQSVLFPNADEVLSDTIRIVNSLMCFDALIRDASLIVPLSTNQRTWRQLGEPCQFPNVEYKADNLYQTSAILATYLDTLSLRYRLREAINSSLGGFCGDVTNYGRKLAAAGLSLPFRMSQEQDLIDCLDQMEGSLFTCITPNCQVKPEYVVQTVSVRGIPSNRLKQPMERAQRQIQMAAYKCNSVSEMLQLYFQCSYHNSMAHVMASPLALPTRIPFPQEIFSNVINTQGFVGASLRTDEQKVASVPTLATVQSSADLGDMLECLDREAKRIKLKKLHRFIETGLSEDDFLEALENMRLFKDNYEDNYEL